MAKTYNKIKYIIMVLVIAITCCGFGSYTVYASTVTSYDDTTCYDDLSTMLVDGEAFDFADYPANSESDIKIISVVEYCYWFDEGNLSEEEQSLYGIYFYIYNPQKIDIDVNSVKNKITLGTDYESLGGATSYTKYSLDCLSVTSNNLFYKFKIVDSSSVKATVDQAMQIQVDYNIEINVCNRRYDLSELELLTVGNNNATAYKIGGQYSFSGFAVGMNNNTTSTLVNSATNDLETIEIEVKSTTYRTGEYKPSYQYDISSVYFSVPNEYIERNGALFGIGAEWYQYETTPMFVANNSTSYASAYDMLGVDLGSSGYNSNYDFNFVRYLSMDGGYYFYANAYNLDFGSGDWGTSINKLSWVFQSDDDGYVSNDDVENFYYSNENNSNLDFFTDTSVGYVNTYIDNTTQYDLDSYESQVSFWENFAKYGFFGSPEYEFDGISDVSPIYVPTASELSSSNASSNLLINSRDVSEIQSAYDTAVSNDETLQLFRFSITDYYSVAVSSVSKNLFGIYGVGDEIGYVSESTCFLDFDILYLTFMLENGQTTIMPVVSSPISIFQELTAPIEDDGSDWWVWLIIAILAFLVILIFLPHLINVVFTALFAVLKIVVKVIVLVITFPFKLLAGLIRAIKGG